MTTEVERWAKVDAVRELELVAARWLGIYNLEDPQHKAWKELRMLLEEIERDLKRMEVESE